MTRKDHTRFAEHVKFHHPKEEKETIINFLIPVFKEDNYNFKEEYFRKACKNGN